MYLLNKYSSRPLRRFSRIVQLLSCVWLFATPWTAAHQPSLSITISLSLFKPMSIESVMPSNHLILFHPFFLPPSIFPSIRVFPKGWLFSPGGQSIGASASASVLLRQVGSSCSSRDSQESSPTPQFMASILPCSAFFMVQLSHPHMTTGEPELWLSFGEFYPIIMK